MSTHTRGRAPARQLSFLPDADQGSAGVGAAAAAAPPPPRRRPHGSRGRAGDGTQHSQHHASPRGAQILGATCVAIAIDQDLLDPRARPLRAMSDDTACDDDALTASISQHGVVVPLLVRVTDDGRYRLIVGARRLHAARQLGLARVPCLVVAVSDDDEAEVLNIVENLHRADLHAVDEAAAYGRMKERGMDLRAIAAVIGRSHEYVRRRLLLAADAVVCAAVRRGALGVTAAEELAAVRDPAIRGALLTRLAQGDAVTVDAIKRAGDVSNNLTQHDATDPGAAVDDVMGPGGLDATSRHGAHDMVPRVVARDGADAMIDLAQLAVVQQFLRRAKHGGLRAGQAVPAPLHAVLAVLRQDLQRLTADPPPP